jgi:hypothetical protein
MSAYPLRKLAASANTDTVAPMKYETSRTGIGFQKSLPKTAGIIFWLLFVGHYVSAQQTELTNSVSPKLRQFLFTHPKVTTVLSNAISEAFSNRTVRIFYFYSNDKSVAPAGHYYPDESSVGIILRENQEPGDECLCLIFEIFNSMGEKRFRELGAEAASRSISREDFVKGMVTQEFEAVKKMKLLTKDIMLSGDEMKRCHYYKLFADSPDDFAHYLIYMRKTSAPRNQEKDYGDLYDSLSKS